MRSPSSISSTQTKTPCCSKVGLKRGPWTPEEDELLAKYIKKEGEGKWRTLPKKAGLLRCGKSCRLRWMNYLRPCVKRGQISPDEEDLILRLHRLLGNRWSLIAGRIPGRTDNEIKNYWNTHLSKKLINQGIDPRTHKPLNLDSIDHQKASSSKATNITRKSSSPKALSKHNNTTTTPDSATAAGEETTSENNKENLYSGSPSFDQITTTTTTTTNYNINNNNNNATYGFTSLLRSIDIDWENNIQGLSNEEIENNYCNDYGSDDAFSSFLNSIINEEAFTSQQHQQEGNNINGVLPASEPLLSVNGSSFGFETDWESAALLPNIFNQTDPSKRVNDDHF